MFDKNQKLMNRFQSLVDKYWTVPFHVAGIFPGTRVAVVSLDRQNVYLNEVAGEDGEVRGRIPRRLVGKQVFAPVRLAGLKYDHDFQLVVQPWGLFRSIKQTTDYAYDKNGPAPQTELVERYIKGDAEIQFAVRQVVNRTVYFWMLLILGVIAFLLKFVGISENLALGIGVLLASIKAGAARHALGLARRAIHKS
ncbi:MAG: hypothetical protein JNL16_09685 [Dechloromonas sp.]|nr:hypothetical protein [Dechloromonas sp.]